MTPRITFAIGAGIGILVGIGAALLMSAYAPGAKYERSETTGEETDAPSSDSIVASLPKMSDIPGTKQIDEERTPPHITVIPEPTAEDMTLIHETIEKFKLSSRKRECLLVTTWENDEQTITVEVRENHTPECGGDPETAPRLFTLEIHKSTGRAYSDRFSGDGTFEELLPGM